MEAFPNLKIDLSAEAAYLRLSNNQVEQTRELTESVLVDLDSLGVVVGVEILDLDTPVPAGRLTKEFHVREDQLEAVRYLGNPARSFLLSTQPQGSSSFGTSTSGTGTLQSC